MKVSDLTGAALDYWVARADGFLGGTVSEAVDAFNGEREPIVFTTSNGTLRVAKEESVVDWLPSTDWSQGGPIMQRALISVLHGPVDDPNGVDYWTGFIRPSDDEGFDGETPLVAAMRAFIASKFGNEVPDESI